MKGSVATLLLASLGSTLAAPSAQPISRATAFFSAQQLKADSAPNAVSMDEMMNLKMQSKAADRAAGMYKKNKYKKQRYLPCSNGKAGEFACKNADLQYFIPHQQMESQAREGNDLWGEFIPEKLHLCALKTVTNVVTSRMDFC